MPGVARGACRPRGSERLPCRPQMVRRQDGLFYRLLKELQRLTGYGVVLNTSLNLHGQPLVYTHEEAIGVLQQTPLNGLIMGEFWVKKQEV